MTIGYGTAKTMVMRDLSRILRNESERIRKYVQNAMTATATDSRFRYEIHKQIIPLIPARTYTLLNKIMDTFTIKRVVKHKNIVSIVGHYKIPRNRPKDFKGKRVKHSGETGSGPYPPTYVGRYRPPVIKKYTRKVKKGRGVKASKILYAKYKLNDPEAEQDYQKAIAEKIEEMFKEDVEKRLRRAKSQAKRRNFIVKF